MTKTLLSLITLFAACTLPGVNAQSATTPAPAASAVADDALFIALGGQAGIDAIVDDFVTRLVSDPRMSEFFKKTKQPHFRQMLSEQFCSVSGGGCAYSGKSMTEAHQDMDISKADFNALVEVLQAAMDAQHVPFATQNRLLARLAPMHREIIH